MLASFYLTFHIRSVIMKEQTIKETYERLLNYSQKIKPEKMGENVNDADWKIKEMITTYEEAETEIVGKFFSSVIESSKNPDKQGIDLICKTKDTGVDFLLEVKSDFYKSKNLFLETTSRGYENKLSRDAKQTDKPVWVAFLRPNYKLYLLDYKELKKTAEKENWKEFSSKHNTTGYLLNEDFLTQTRPHFFRGVFSLK